MMRIGVDLFVERITKKKGLVVKVDLNVHRGIR